MNADGTNVQELASFGPAPACLGEGGVAWSPDGTRIAFSLNGMLEVMNADGSNPHALTPGDQPAWSPESSQIVFHVYDYSRTDSGLWVIGANGTGLRQLTQGPDDHPSWSPDGKTILFSSERDNPYDAYYPGDSPLTFPELYVVDPDGSNLRPLSFTKPAAFENQTTLYAANGSPLPSLPGVPTLAGNVAAVANTTSSGADQITLFDATSGNQLAVVQVGTGQNPFTLAGADAHWIVFQAGTAISALNTSSHQIIRLHTAPGGLIDLSVAGRRVAWAENTTDLQRPRQYHHRIRILELPN
jgi:Tol biopolymer transport system component